MNYLINANTLSGFDSLVTQLGGSPAEITKKFHIPENFSQRPNSFILFRQAAAMFEYCAEVLNCPDFGLQLSEQQNLSTLGPIAVLARNADNIESAFQSISKYFHLITPAISLDLNIDPRAKHIRMSISVLEAQVVANRQLLELLMGIGQAVTHLLAGREEYALAMHFPHSRLAAKDTYRSFFRCPVHFEQERCAVDLPIAVMQRAISGADAETAKVAAEYLSMQYGHAPNVLVDQVIHLIRQLLPIGQCKLLTVAKELQLHPRTLQRRLTAEGHEFEVLVDSERRALAEYYLSEPELRLTQITGMLGYSDQSALNRSCRRWFNATPRQIRQRL